MPPKICTAWSQTNEHMSVAVFLVIAARAGVCSPRAQRTASSPVSARAAARREAMSASLWRVTWKPLSDLPKAWRSFAYCTASR